MPGCFTKNHPCFIKVVKNNIPDSNEFSEVFSRDFSSRFASSEFFKSFDFRFLNEHFQMHFTKRESRNRIQKGEIIIGTLSNRTGQTVKYPNQK
jgi:hypothetical protein